MRPPRPTIANLMLTVLFVAIFLHTFQRRAIDPSIIFVFVVCGLALIPWVIGPVLIHRTQWVASDPEYVPIDPGGPETPPPVADAIREVVAGLTRLRFVPLGYYYVSNQVPNVEGYVTLFEDGRTHDVAKHLIVIAGGTNFVSHLVFCTEFADGTEFLTSNVANPGVWPLVGERSHRMAFPSLHGAACLHDAHQAMIERVGGMWRRRDLIHGDPFAYLVASETKQLAGQIGTGYYWLDETRRQYRPTWKGAVLMAWKLLWPVGAIRRMWRRLRGWWTLRGLGLPQAEAAL
jgi:hypothetical protein